MDPGKVIAENLKKLRAERELSLSRLAEISGVSKMMLSQIERGEGNPTINTIWKIANGLKVPYTKLLDAPEVAATVVRKHETPEQRGDSPGYRIFAYFRSAPDRNFELFTAELDPLCASESIGHGKKSQEYILVTSGELELVTMRQKYALAAGDAVVFDPTLRHSYINRREEPASFIVLNYYP